MMMNVIPRGTEPLRVSSNILVVRRQILMKMRIGGAIRTFLVSNSSIEKTRQDSFRKTTAAQLPAAFRFGRWHVGEGWWSHAVTHRVTANPVDQTACREENNDQKRGECESGTA
ncbi:hypothetical protein CDAR_393511 [Caerostris darwini]|uniref:Uncharacterized protein n=1 Tax=Caerostris darwini TaxID=1538125 RepID=A0AAV4W755_9ARAC|nr:hypothetical protein CDAR_393511 [Caerostris darwini]